MSGSCQLLPGESPRCFQPTMVRVLGLDDAILVQQVHHRLQYPDLLLDGVPYIRCSYPHLANIVGAGWSESTLKRKVKSAVHDPAKGYLIQRHALDGDLADRTCWYTLDYGRLGELVGIPGLLSQHNVRVDPGVVSDWHDEPLKSEAQDPDPEPRTPDVLRPARGQSGTSPDPHTRGGGDPASAPALSAVAPAQKPTEGAENSHALVIWGKASPEVEAERQEKGEQLVCAVVPLLAAAMMAHQQRHAQRSKERRL